MTPEAELVPVAAETDDAPVASEVQDAPEAVEASDAAEPVEVAAPVAVAPTRTPTPGGRGPADTPESFVVDLPAYAGPLDLLLSLIRDEKVDIYDIPIAHIAKQFLLRIRVLQLNDAAEYLELAARLLRIKAQMLLPRHGEAETWEDPRAELVRRLLEYQQMREVVDILERRGDERRNRFGRTYLPEASGDTVAAPLALSLGELLTAVDRILRVTKEPTVHTVVARALDVAGAIATVRDLIMARRAARWSDLVARDAEPWQILSMLLALLELAKLGELRLAQPRPFASVEIEHDSPGEAA